LLTRPGGGLRRGGLRGVSALEMKFASRIGNILEFRWGGLGKGFTQCGDDIAALQYQIMAVQQE
jgi:hypothetical protein